MGRPLSFAPSAHDHGTTVTVPAGRSPPSAVTADSCLRPTLTALTTPAAASKRTTVVSSDRQLAAAFCGVPPHAVMTNTGANCAPTLTVVSRCSENVNLLASPTHGSSNFVHPSSTAADVSATNKIQ